jgi:hypothetical protein
VNVSPNEKSSWASEGRQPAIAIIGAGMSGIAAVVELRKAGYTNLTVYEKADRVGGTWRENTYPGLSCDIPSRWYSFRFALNPDWSHRFSYGPEIQAYMERVACDFDVEPGFLLSINAALTRTIPTHNDFIMFPYPFARVFVRERILPAATVRVSPVPRGSQSSVVSGTLAISTTDWSRCSEDTLRPFASMPSLEL